MKRRIPKKAQAQLDSLQRQRAARAALPDAPKAELVMPRRLDIASMPGPYCRSFEVFFNGQLQTMLKVADAELGYIERYKATVWDPVHRCQKALPPYETEIIYGQVTIRRKGQREDLVKQTRKPWEEGT